MAPSASTAQGDAESPKTFTTLVIDNGTIHPVSSEPFVGRIVVRDGLIAAVGPDVAMPDGTPGEDYQLIDATNLNVYPGLIDAFSQVGLVEVNAVPSTDDQAEMGAYNPHLQALTALHPASEVIPVTRSNGITHALIAPLTDDDGVIAGQAALVNLAGWTAEEMAIDPSIAMVINWPAIQTRRFDFSTFSMVETPFTEAKEKAEARQNELRDWFDAARHYKQAVAAGSRRLDPDLKLEALAECLDRGKKVIILANNKRDIESAVAFAEEQNLDMILGGGEAAWEVADPLAEKGIPVILGLTQNLPDEDDDPYDRPFRNAGALVDAGVKIAFASGAGGGFGPGGPHGARTTMYEAGTAAAYGLTAEDALKAVTTWPAEILGVGAYLGTIESGKIADLVVLEGNPLEITGEVERLIIAGREVSTDDRQRELYEEYRSRPGQEPAVEAEAAPKG
jgi:imidazolonepropionase-like amidohydrolase